jgi:PAS domain S-box-containing protein
MREEISGLSEELQVMITELRQKNLELAQTRNQVEAERARYKDLFEFAPDGYLETDRMGIVLEVNQAGSRMLKVATEFLIGKPLAMYIHEDDRRDFRTWLVQLSSRRADLVFEKRDLRLKPRRLPLIDVTITVGIPPPSSDDSNQRLRWMIHDISALKLAHRELQQARSELEIRVEARTRELSAANRELEEANQRLEKKNLELQEFAFIASHDLQEPLRKIKGFGEQLQRKPMDETGRDFLGRMIEASVRMQTMLDGLLEYARVNYTGQPFVEYDLGRLAQEVLNDMEYTLMQTGGRVQVGEMPTLRLDPQQMYRLFQNLIANSLKFHRPDAPPELVITAEEQDHLVTLRFQDNGVGFEERFRERLFQPFSRLHGRSQFEGSGMGLAICRKIVERHGGEIDAEGRPGEGATFVVTLPKGRPA